MKNKILIIILVFNALTVYCIGKETSFVVTVIDQAGEALNGVSINAGHPVQGSSDQIYSGTTSKDGEFSFTANPKHYVTVKATKEGYYSSAERVYIYKDNGTPKPDYYKPKIKILLKKVTKPTPLVARSNFIIKIPEKEQQIGFDLELCDWVSPFGIGKNADVFIHARGYYNEPKDREIVVSMTFPNDGDGLVAFKDEEKQYGSFLRSEFTAPLSGYKKERIWKKGRSLAINRKPWEGSVDKVESYDPANNYYFRVRTETDENGRIKEANYGKIYGDLIVGGEASPDGLFIKIEAYYFNPENNDRNVEFKVGSNLLADVIEREQPNFP